MKGIISFLVVMVLAGCAQESDTTGVVYSGKANLSTPLHQFTAINDDSGKDIILTMTGPRELTFNINDSVSHIDYEEKLIIIRSETDQSEWTAKKVRGGFELEDGTSLEYENCQGWTICLLDGGTKLPLLKGKYTLHASSVEITLWISESEKHVELLGLMANALFNKSRYEKQSIESALETLSSQVWTY